MADTPRAGMPRNKAGLRYAVKPKRRDNPDQEDTAEGALILSAQTGGNEPARGGAESIKGNDTRWLKQTLADIAAGHAELEKEKAELERQKAAFAKYVSAQSTEAERIKAAMRSQAQKLRTNSDALDKSIETYQRDNACLQRREAEITAHRAELEAIGTQYAKKDAELKERQAYLGQLKGDLDFLAGELKDGNKKLDADRAAYEQQKAELDKARAAYEQQKAELNAYKKSLDLAAAQVLNEADALKEDRAKYEESVKEEVERGVKEMRAGLSGQLFALLSGSEDSSAPAGSTPPVPPDAGKSA